MPTSSNADTLDLNNCRVYNIGSEQEINLFGEELIKVLKEISKRLYDIGVDIANK